MSISGIGKVYQDVQKIRIALSNKTWAAEAGRSAAVPKVFETMIQQLEDIEKQLMKVGTDELKYHPAWPWLSKVKGLGTTLAVQLLGHIGDIGRFETVSKLWRYAGLGVINGRAERKRQGEKLHYKPQFKTLMYKIGESFIKTKSPYKKIYDEKKSYYQHVKQDVLIAAILDADRRENPPGKLHTISMWQKLINTFGYEVITWSSHEIIAAVRQYEEYLKEAYRKARKTDKNAKKEVGPWGSMLKYVTKEAKKRGFPEPWSDVRVHQSAMRKMEKVFLAHTWEVWRKAEGLPTKREYVFDYLGHETRYTPEEFAS